MCFPVGATSEKKKKIMNTNANWSLSPTASDALEYITNSTTNTNTRTHRLISTNSSVAASNFLFPFIFITVERARRLHALDSLSTGARTSVHFRLRREETVERRVKKIENYHKLAAKEFTLKYVGSGCNVHVRASPSNSSVTTPSTRVPCGWFQYPIKWGATQKKKSRK